MAPASTGLTDYVKAGEATAILDTESQTLFSRLQYEPAEKTRSAPEHPQGKYCEQVELKGTNTIGGIGHSFRTYSDKTGKTKHLRLLKKHFLLPAQNGRRHN